MPDTAIDMADSILFGIPESASHSGGLDVGKDNFTCAPHRS